MEDSQKELSVLVDRAIGGSSILDGQIELMVHRFVVLQILRLIVQPVVFTSAGQSC